ncbi:type III secretion system chaperone [Desulfocurvus sp. DL9XJH121]
MNNVSAIISEFGQAIGLDGLVLDDNGCCTLKFDEVVVNVEYLPDSEEFYFYSRVGQAPEDQESRLAVFALLLESDCFYRRTSGGILGLDADSDSLVYTNKIGADGWLNATIFGEYVQAFVNLAEEFEREIKEIAVRPKGGNDTPLDPSRMTLRV